MPKMAALMIAVMTAGRFTRSVKPAAKAPAQAASDDQESSGDGISFGAAFKTDSNAPYDVVSDKLDVDDNQNLLAVQKTEAQVRLVDRCLQLHGGYGYMREYPVARAYLDARVQTIYGGTTEIMKEIIGRDIERRVSR